MVAPLVLGLALGAAQTGAGIMQASSARKDAKAQRRLMRQQEHKNYLYRRRDLQNRGADVHHEYEGPLGLRSELDNTLSERGIDDSSLAGVYRGELDRSKKQRLDAIDRQIVALKEGVDLQNQMYDLQAKADQAQQIYGTLNALFSGGVGAAAQNYIRYS